MLYFVFIAMSIFKNYLQGSWRKSW